MNAFRQTAAQTIRKDLAQIQRRFASGSAVPVSFSWLTRAVFLGDSTRRHM